MSLITRQGKGSKLTIQEMDNNLLYLEGLGESTGMTQAKIGSDTDYSLFDTDGSLTFHGNATTYTDQTVDILSEISSNPLSSGMFINNNLINTNYAQFYSGSCYGTFNVSGYTALNTALLNGTFSISFWFKYIGSGVQQIFNIPNFLNIIITSTNRIQVVNQSGFKNSINTIMPDYWNHVCYVQTASGGILYLNNIMSEIIPSLSYSLPGSGVLNYFGFIGDISNLRIYNLELNYIQIAELYNLSEGIAVDLQPSGIISATDVLFDIRNLENSGTSLHNYATLGSGINVILHNNPVFTSGPIGRGSVGVYLPKFPALTYGTLGSERSLRFEMNHNWKTGTNIDLHMHISTNEKILSGQTIVFRIEKTIQDIYAVLSTTSLTVLNSGKTFPLTSAVTYTFSSHQDIPAYTNLVLDFDNIDMSQYTSVSTCGSMTIARLYGTFPGDIFEVQSLRMHYEIDSTGSRSEWSK
jgi:hypothetical protein